MSSRCSVAIRFVAGAAAFAIVSSCAVDRINLPFGKSQLVIYGVMSPTAPVLTVLVEHTLTGEFASLRYGVLPLDYTEAVYSDGGVPEREATVELTTPSGVTFNGTAVLSTTLTAEELPTIVCFPLSAVNSPVCAMNSGLRFEGNGAGMYIFALAGSFVVPGGTYKLRVTTKGGEVVTAETTIPVATPVVTPGPTAAFNRTIDTLGLTWPVNPRAPAYQVRVETPYGAWFAFTDSTRVALTGSLRNVTDGKFPSVFVPGFQQTVSVSAVDTNMFDYYRSANNSFVGSGIINHVKGGLGVFGALVPVSRRTITVTAQIQRPIEGRFDLVPDAFGLGYSYGPAAITIYEESPAVRKDQLSAMTAGITYGVNSAGSAVGTYDGTKLKLFFVSADLRDTSDAFVAQLHGDTLIGNFNKGAPGKYIRH